MLLSMYYPTTDRIKIFYNQGSNNPITMKRDIDKHLGSFTVDMIS